MNFHQKSLLIGMVTVLLSVGAFLWIVVFNKGVLLISTDAPFAVRAEGQALKIPKTLSCATSPCTLKLPAGRYRLFLSKKNHYDEEMTADVQRGETQSLDVNFSIVPQLKPVSDYDTFLEKEGIAEEGSDLQRFRFEFDAAHAKQRLVYTESDTQASITWAYFDRELVNPVVFPSPDFNHAIVVDRAEVEQKLYWIDGVNFKRAYVGSLTDVSEVLWGDWQEDGPELLVRTVASRSGDAQLWMVDVEQAELTEWPFDFTLEKALWDEHGGLIFLTTQDVKALEGSGLQTPFDAVKALLKGEILNEDVGFVIAEYQPSQGQYRVLLEVPISLGLSAEKSFLIEDPDGTGRIFLSDGITVYEIRRS